MAEGVDYSWTPNDNWLALAHALQDQGKEFVGRYAVNDKSSNGRGIDADEYRVMKSVGIEVFVYWEAETSWMLGGFNRGAAAARNAVQNLKHAGMPEDMPVYYSHDIEPNPRDYAAVDACLQGAASVVGRDAVGLYGGYGIIEHVANNKLAPWLCQTYAWSGGRLHSSSHLYQYDNYGNYIGGVDVDLVRSLKAKYGQASLYDGSSPVKPKYAKRIPIPGPIRPQFFNGAYWIPTLHTRWRALEKTKRLQRADPNAEEVGPPIEAGDVVTLVYTTANEGIQWLSTQSGTRVLASSFIKG
jgi:hypothetical protein